MRLIDSDTLREQILNDNTYDNDTVNYYLALVDDAITIDPVHHGIWEHRRFPHIGGKYRCSICNGIFGDEIERTSYCPSCGAKNIHIK